MKNDLQKQKKLSQPFALEDVMKPKTSFSSHFPFLLLWFNHKTVLVFPETTELKPGEGVNSILRALLLEISLNLVSFANDTISRI